MPKIKFSYTFDEEMDRVYENFSNEQLNKDIAFKNFATNIKFIKGERFDEENSEFSFVWKNYYNIKMIVQNHINKENFRTYTHKSLFIDKVIIDISLAYYYYWDTVEQKTVFILDLEYKDEFFGDLINSEVKQSDITKICENVENYINDPLCGFEFTNYSYYVLFKMTHSLHKHSKKFMVNPNLKIMSISGVDDRTTSGTKGVRDSIKHLLLEGYDKLSYKEYPNMKHEILMEDDKDLVIADVIKFYGE